MTESIIVVAAVVLVYGIFSLVTHKAEKALKEQKSLEQSVSSESAGMEKKS
jgi:hypothetical protein